VTIVWILPVFAACRYQCIASPCQTRQDRQPRLSRHGHSWRSLPAGEHLATSMIVFVAEPILAVRRTTTSRVLGEANRAARRTLREASGVRFRPGGGETPSSVQCGSSGWPQRWSGGAKNGSESPNNRHARSHNGKILPKFSQGDESRRLTWPMR